MGDDIRTLIFHAQRLEGTGHSQLRAAPCLRLIGAESTLPTDLTPDGHPRWSMTS